MTETVYFTRLNNIWESFIASFQSHTTQHSYHSDINEFLRIINKDFENATAEDVKKYYELQNRRVQERKLAPSTLAKKMRELNSLAVYIDENKELFHIKDTYQNHFAPYIMQVEKLSKHANSVPVEDIDKLLKAAQTDHMAYCIIIFLYRMGFTSTEITEIKPDNISVYENGAYIRLVGHNRASYIPEDVFQILENYMKERESYEYLFYNKYGNKLNTMYISRMLKKYTTLAQIRPYSAQSLRNSCIYTLFSYGATISEVSEEMDITRENVRRYQNINYIDETSRSIRNLVKLKAELPSDE